MVGSTHGTKYGCCSTFLAELCQPYLLYILLLDLEYYEYIFFQFLVCEQYFLRKFYIPLRKENNILLQQQENDFIPEDIKTVLFIL